MQPIPLKLRNKLSECFDMKVCVHNNCECQGRIEWEHVWLYSGKQIQEDWAIIPCCFYHHRGNGLDKDFNRYCSLKKANEINKNGIQDCYTKYPKKDWLQLWSYLKEKYEK